MIVPSRKWRNVRGANIGLVFQNAPTRPLSRFGRYLASRQARRFSRAGEQLGTPYLVSVIMTSYNSEKYLAQALESLLSQTHRNLEIIVVDDASTDGSRNVLSNFAKRDARLRVFRSDTNRGTYWSKNIGLLVSRGDYVTFHDSDDWSHSDRIRTQLGAILFYSGEALASICCMARVDDERRILPVNERVARMACISLMFERRVVLKNVGFFDNVRIAADTEFVERLRLICGPESFVRVNAVLYEARHRPGSLSADQRRVGAVKGSIATTLKGERAEYLSAARAWHQGLKGAPGTVCMGFSNKDRPFPAPQSIRVEIVKEEVVEVAEMTSDGRPRTLDVSDLLASVGRF